MTLRQKKIRLLITSIIASATVHPILQAAEGPRSTTGLEATGNICKEISFRDANENFYFVKDGHASNLGLNAGEFDLANIPGGELYVKDALLIIPSRLSLASSSCGNSICISNQEIAPLCPRTKTYRLSVMLDSMALGPGSFQSNESLSFYDKQGGEFENGFSVSGAIHKPQSTLVASREDAKKLFANKAEVLKASIKNTGDRDLKIRAFSQVKNTAGIQVKVNECQNRVLNPNQTCSLQFERIATASNGAEQYYEVSFDSNDIFGFGKIIISREKKDRIDIGIWYK